MLNNEVQAFLRENPVCFIATLEGNQPRVRAFLTVQFEDGCIYFTTAASKDTYQQLSKNPNVELCYCTQNFKRMLRIAGKIEVVDDQEKKQKLIDERDYLKGWGAGDPNYILLRLSHGKARFWTIENNLREREIPVIEF